MNWTRKFLKTAAALTNPTSAAPDFLPVLSAGSHHDPSYGACFMEYISVLRGEEFGAYSPSVNPFIAAVARSVNDYSPVNRAKMIDLMGPAMGTGTGDRNINNLRGIELERLAHQKGFVPTWFSVGNAYSASPDLFHLRALIDLYYQVYGAEAHVITREEVARVVKVGLPA